MDADDAGLPRSRMDETVPGDMESALAMKAWNRSRLGANYLPSGSGVAMWRHFDPEGIATDLGRIADVGVGWIRAFLLWPEFMPTQEQVAPEMLDRLERFLDIVEEAGLGLQLTLLVGHMSGENWLPDWIPDPARLYDDEWLLERQDQFLSTVVERVRGSSCLEAYALTNESTRLTGPAPSAAVERWARRLCGAVRALDPNRPISLGDGAWYVFGEENGFSPDHDQDIIGPHLYLSDTDPRRLVAAHGIAVGTAVAMARGREVWLEEFGAPHSVFGEDEIAGGARDVAAEAFLQGATRVCWWAATDFTAGGALPYRHHAFEMSFGLLRADGEARPVAGALVEAAAGPRPEGPEARILLSSYLTQQYPFSLDDADLGQRALRNSYAALRGLGYIPRIVLERDLLEGEAGSTPLVIPAAQKLLAPTWEALEHIDAPVLFSYFHGANSFHGAWTHRAAQFFGGRP